MFFVIVSPALALLTNRGISPELYLQAEDSKEMQEIADKNHPKSKASTKIDKRVKTTEARVQLGSRLGLGYG